MYALLLAFTYLMFRSKLLKASSEVASWQARQKAAHIAIYGHLMAYLLDCA